MERADPRINVLRMGMEAFNSLYTSLRRNEARDLLRNAWISAAAANSPKHLEPMLKPYEGLLVSASPMYDDKGYTADERAFLKLAGNGF